jgi:tryptophan synthase alpha chain
MNRIEQTFQRLKRKKRKALIGYITAGFPTKLSFRKLVPFLEQSGLDLLEVGVPFSDPIADGPTIQHASQVALANGVTLDWVLRSVRDIRARSAALPIIFMSYCNPIHAMGIDRFFKTARHSGVDGLIIPDLIPEESGPYAQAARREGIALIFLVAPTTPKRRIRMIAQKTRGFLYAVSITGVTGVQKAVPTHVSRFLKTVRSASSQPVAVGFGLTTPPQVHAVSRDADGVIVGSALIRALEKSNGSSFRAAGRFVQSLARALNPGKDSSHAS